MYVNSCRSAAKILIDRKEMSEIRQPPAARRQDPGIQALRGIAVILMVTGHVINPVIGGSGRSPGLHPDYWLYFYRSLADIRMPLFTLISGYVYAMVPVAQWRDYPQLIRGKSRRLLLPLITVSTALYVLERFVEGTRSVAHGIPLWHVYVFEFAHMWFLQSIFVIFVVVGIFDSSGLLASRVRCFGATAVAAILFVVVHVPTAVDVFSVSKALHLLPFFLLGYGMRRHSFYDLRGTPAIIAALTFATLFTVRLLTIFGVYQLDQLVDKAVSVGVGTTALLLIYSARNLLNARWLAWVGGFSFGIYLLHIFATAASHKLLEHFGVHQFSELFVAGLLMGIGAPIAFQLVFGKMPFVRTFVLGERSTFKYWDWSTWKSRTERVSAGTMNRPGNPGGS
jgi:acyltransferase